LSSDSRHQQIAGLFAVAGTLAWVGGAGAATAQELQRYHESARNATRDVLATDEFSRLGVDNATWMERMIGWVIGIIQTIGGWFQSLPSWLAWLLVGWMVLTLVAIFIHLIYTLVQMLGSSGSKRVPRDHAWVGDELLGVQDLRFDSVLERAQQMLAEGRWLMAVRYLYVASVVWLAEREIVIFRKDKTNRDYLRELARRPAERELFGEMTLLFETAVYGRASATEQDCRRMSDLIEKIRAQTTAHP